ncbi:MAG: hypothetical protein LCH44_14995 [Bacteroidetes bacterium]|jgi:hypothetical protein|nr:hypothetical protein [Bacteroidota bacterium]
MIRIYLDWSVVSNFKKDEFAEIREFISEHKDYLQFPYSPAHFKDLMKSYNSDNEYFNQDLQNLEYLSEKHLLRWGKDGIEVLFGTPQEYFEGEKDSEDVFSMMDIEKIFNDLDADDFGIGKFGTLIKSLYQLMPTGIEITDENKEILQKMFPNIDSNSSMWDLMKDITPFSKRLLTEKEYYKDFRKTISDKGFKLDPNSGNWNVDEVFNNIDTFLQKQNTKLTFREYVNTCFKNRKEPVNRFEFYTTAYLLLDMIGYKSDNLPKPTDNMQNIQNDAEHSFYSAHCDYFVVIDKKLTIKTKVLFKEFNIPTVVISPKEFIDTIKSKLHFIETNKHFVNEAIGFLEKENIVETYEKGEEIEVDTFAFKLPIFYFNFFNYAVYQNYSDQNAFVLTFKRVFKNYSNFIYYTESERLIDRICNFFGYDNNQEHLDKKQEFVYGDKEVAFIWNFEGGLIKLEKDVETHRPLLTYIILTNEK